MKGKRIGGLAGIDLTSGTAEDGPVQFRGFVTVRATADDGSVLMGQLDPGEVRQMAMQFLECAEAAEQDRIVMTMMVRDVGLEAPVAANFIAGMRAERDK